MSGLSTDQSAKIRDNLTYNLKLVIKKLQFQAASTFEQSFQSSEVTNALCYVLESIFLLALKSPFSTKQILDASTNTKIASPTFWPFVVKFTHNEVATQLSSLKFITNETGLCRSWIRMALNDGLLTSYIGLIVNGDVKLKKKFYNKESYWFDDNQTILLIGLLQGIVNYKFDLPHNVSLLNSWGTTPLELAGYFKITNLPVLFPPDSLPKAMPAEVSSLSQPVASQQQTVIETFVNQDLSSAVGIFDDVTSSRRGNRRHRKRNATKGRRQTATLSLRTESSSQLSLTSTNSGDTNRLSKNLESSDLHLDVDKSDIGVGSESRSITPEDYKILEQNIPDPKEDNIIAVSASLQEERSSLLDEKEAKSADLITKASGGNEQSQPTLGIADMLLNDNKVSDASSEQRTTIDNFECKDKNPTETLHFDANVMFAVEDDVSGMASTSSVTGGTNDADISDFSQRITPSPPGNNVHANIEGCWTDTARSSPNLYALMGLQYIGNSVSRNDSCTTSKTEASHNTNREVSEVNRNTLGDADGQSTIQREYSTGSQDFEIIQQSGLTYDLTETASNDFKAIYTTLSHEKGLPSQNYMCLGCSSPIGTIYGKFKVCSFDSKYYCSRCHCDDEAVIPAYIVHNWDFKPFKVSCAAKTFLVEMENEPLIDFDQVNNNLYEYIQPLRVMFDKRKRLKYAANYLFSCSETTSNEVKSRLWPKDYMLTNLHLYSVQDLLQIQTGYLQAHLQRVLDYCIRHIDTCVVCKQKGFICEICHESEIIYAFDIEGTVTCEKCFTVFHKRCKSDYAPCPKCVRRANYSISRTLGVSSGSMM